MKYKNVGNVDELIKAYADGERDFSQIDLENANLSQADLSGINLNEANLRGANLAYANLSEANLQGANLTKANLRRANLTGSNLKETILEKVDFYLANLSWCDLSNQKLSNANLTRVDFQGTNLSNANLNRANLNEAKLDRANLIGAILTAAKLEGAYLPYAELNQANLQEAELVGADLTGTNLEQSNLDRANLKSARLRKVNFYKASLQQAYLQNCKLQMANLTEANLQKANLINAECENTNFTQTDLRGVEIDLAKDANVELATTGHLERQIKHSLHLELEAYGNSFAFSPDSKIIAYCDRDNKITLVNINTEKKRIQIDIEPEPVVSVVFSQDGKTLYHSIYLNDFKIWNPFTGKLINNLKNHSANLTSLILNSKVEPVATIGTGEPYQTFDVGHEVRTLRGYSTGIKTEARSPDGKLIARSTPNKSSEVELLDSQTGKKIHTFSNYQQPVQSLTFSPDSKLLATKSIDDFRIYQVATGQATYSNSTVAYKLYYNTKPEIEFINNNSGQNTVLITSYLCGVFSHRHATRSDQNNIDLKWDTGGGSTAHHSLVISADKKICARKYHKQPIQIWDLERVNELTTLNLDYESYYGFALSPTGDSLAVRKNNKREIDLWDIKTSTLIKKFTGHSDFIYAIVFSPDGRILATGSEDRTIKIWNLETGETIATLRDYATISSLAFHPLKPILAAGNDEGTISLWDLNSKSEIHRFTAHENTIYSLEFSPNGKWLASSDRDNRLRLWILD